MTFWISYWQITVETLRTDVSLPNYFIYNLTENSNTCNTNKIPKSNRFLFFCYCKRSGWKSSPHKIMSAKMQRECGVLYFGIQLFSPSRSSMLQSLLIYVVTNLTLKVKISMLMTKSDKTKLIWYILIKHMIMNVL